MAHIKRLSLVIEVGWFITLCRKHTCFTTAWITKPNSQRHLNRTRLWRDFDARFRSSTTAGCNRGSRLDFQRRYCCAQGISGIWSFSCSRWRVRSLKCRIDCPFDPTTAQRGERVYGMVTSKNAPRYSKIINTAVIVMKFDFDHTKNTFTR